MANKQAAGTRACLDQKLWENSDLKIRKIAKAMPLTQAVIEPFVEKTIKVPALAKTDHAHMRGIGTMGRPEHRVLKMSSHHLGLTGIVVNPDADIRLGNG